MIIRVKEQTNIQYLLNVGASIQIVVGNGGITWINSFI